jgi:hypothetical protein
MVFGLLLAFLLAQQLVMAQESVMAQNQVTPQRANHIDSLTTTDQVLTYIRKLTGYESETLLPTPGKKLNIVKPDGRPYIHAYQVSRKIRDSWSLKKNKPIRKDYTEYRSDTLRWIQNALLEIAPRVEHTIDSITYALVGGFTTTGGFRLTIKQDALLLEKQQDMVATTMLSRGGIFIARLDTASHNELYSLLEYIDFPHLKNDYQSDGSDAPTVILKIAYDNGCKICDH